MVGELLHDIQNFVCRNCFQNIIIKTGFYNVFKISMMAVFFVFSIIAYSCIYQNRS